MSTLSLDNHKSNESSTTTTNLPRIAAALMLRNESKRLHITLNSLKGYINGLIIYDTGSTDNTIEILQEWCKENSIPLHLTQGEFVDFSSSRNVLFDFADKVHDELLENERYHFLLLLDCNDELQNGPKFLTECMRFMEMKEKVFMMRQRWLTGTFVNKYLNARLVKAKHGWRYKKRVHEYLSPPDNETIRDRPHVSEDVILYQNRNDDDDKTQKRFRRDKQFLLEDVKEGNDPRDMFYLAQTLSCLNEFEDSYSWYQKRGEIIEGFWEERFHAYLRSAEICVNHKKDVDLAVANYIKAAMIDFRAEPLIALGKIYREKQDFLLSYLFLSAACGLEFPYDRILFISERDYNYERWVQLSIVAFYVNKFEEGTKALEIARATGNEPDVHIKNTEAYVNAKASGKTEAGLFAPEDLPPEIDELHEGFLKDGKQALADKDPDSTIINFIRAFQLSHRAGPLLMLAEYARLIKAFHMSFMLAHFAWQLEIPKDLNKKNRDYSYLRYHLVGIVAYYTGKYTIGKEACIKAIKEGQNIILDRKNLAAYLNAEKIPKEPKGGNNTDIKGVSEQYRIPNTTNSTANAANTTTITTVSSTNESLNKYKERRIQELMALNPKMQIRQAQAKAQLEWKLMNKGK